jgi:hypothetical protein
MQQRRGGGNAESQHVRVRRGAPLIVDLPGESQEQDPPEVINISDVPPPGEAIEIGMSSDDDMDSPNALREFQVSSDTDSDSSYEGLPGSYYGGSGTCYRCGNNIVSIGKKAPVNIFLDRSKRSLGPWLPFLKYPATVLSHMLVFRDFIFVIFLLITLSSSDFFQCFSFKRLIKCVN